MFECLECGKKFKTVKAAEKAVNNGCPKCGGVDIDLARTAVVVVPKTKTSPFIFVADIYTRKAGA